MICRGFIVGKPSRYQQLPPEDRTFVERRQYQNGYADIDGLQADLKERGHDIPRSTCGEMNKFLKEKTNALREKTQITTSIIEAAGENAHNLGLAANLLLQNEAVDMLSKLKLDEIDFQNLPDHLKIKLFFGLSETHLNASRSIQIQQKAKLEIQEQIKKKAQEAAKEVVQTVKDAGLSDEQATLIRNKILNVAQ